MGGMSMKQCTALFYVNLTHNSHWEKEPSTEKRFPADWAVGRTGRFSQLMAEV